MHAGVSTYDLNVSLMREIPSESRDSRPSAKEEEVVAACAGSMTSVDRTVGVQCSFQICASLAKPLAD